MPRFLKSTQDSILDLASHDSRTPLSQQLQHLGNSVAADASDGSWQPKDSKDPIDPKDNSTATVTFDLLGLCEVNAFVSIEEDQFLRSHVGSMVIHLEPPREHANLTESNLQTLQSLTHPLSQIGHVVLPNRSPSRRGSSRSRRSSRSRGSAARGSARSGRSGSVGLGSPRNSAGGAISDLHSDSQEIITKLTL